MTIRNEIKGLLAKIAASRPGKSWLLALLAMVALPAGYVGSGAANGNDALQALIADPMSVFSARSPGARSSGALVQTKTAYAPNLQATADFLGIGPGMGLPGGEGAMGPEPDLGFASPDAGDSVAFTIPGSLYGASEAGPFFGAIGFGAGGLPFGGSGFGSGTPGGGGTVPGGTTPISPAPGATAVPEPEMWLMMIAGFFAVGSAMRGGSRRNSGARH